VISVIRHRGRSEAGSFCAQTCSQLRQVRITATSGWSLIGVDAAPVVEAESPGLRSSSNQLSIVSHHDLAGRWSGLPCALVCADGFSSSFSWSSNQIIEHHHDLSRCRRWGCAVRFRSWQSRAYRRSQVVGVPHAAVGAFADQDEVALGWLHRETSLPGHPLGGRPDRRSRRRRRRYCVGSGSVCTPRGLTGISAGQRRRCRRDPPLGGKPWNLLLCSCGDCHPAGI
jgi:hypothetical protein